MSLCKHHATGLSGCVCISTYKTLIKPEANCSNCVLIFPNKDTATNLNIDGLNLLLKESDFIVFKGVVKHSEMYNLSYTIN